MVLIFNGIDIKNAIKNPRNLLISLLPGSVRAYFVGKEVINDINNTDYKIEKRMNALGDKATEL